VEEFEVAIGAPGFSPGKITITGNFVQQAGGTLAMDLTGLGIGQYDVLNVGGNASLGGALQISFLDGFTPKVGDRFDILNFGSSTGDFASLFGLGPAAGYTFDVSLSANSLDLVVTSAVPEPSAFTLFGTGILLLGFVRLTPADRIKSLIWHLSETVAS
jgi:hypothetical protein